MGYKETVLARMGGRGMWGLTGEERRVVVFLLGVGLLGVGIRFAVKVSPCSARAVFVSSDFAKIDINQVSWEDLAHTSYIRPNLAKKIIEYRNSRGEFKNIEELKEIKGVGDVRYEKLKDLFMVK